MIEITERYVGIHGHSLLMKLMQLVPRTSFVCFFSFHLEKPMKYLADIGYRLSLYITYIAIDIQLGHVTLLLFCT